MAKNFSILFFAFIKMEDTTIQAKRES